MKILLVTDGFPPKIGGSRTLYYNIYKRLDSKEVVVLTTTKDYLGAEELEGWREFDREQNFKIYRIPLICPKQEPQKNNRITIFESIVRFVTIDVPLMTSVLLKTLKLIKKERINLLWCGEIGSSGWLMLIMKKLFGKKYIVYTHGEEITTKPIGRLWGKETKYLLRNAERIIAVSNFTSTKLIYMGIPKRKIRIIYNGVDDKLFTPQVKDEELIKKYKLRDKKVLLTVGRLDRRKGHDNIIKALPKIIMKVPGVRYLIIGRGMEEKALKELVKNLSLEEYVKFLGFVSNDQLVKHYNLCDVFIMPNRELSDGNTEGFGIVFLEANACGKPVIGGNAGGTSNAIENGKSGYLVDGNDIDSITNVTIRLLKDRSLAQRIGRYGRERVHKYSWDIVAKEFKKLCEEII